MPFIIFFLVWGLAWALLGTPFRTLLEKLWQS